MATLFSDNFNRSTGLGANWAARGTTAWGIVNNDHVEGTSQGNQYDVLRHATAAYGTADYSVSCWMYLDVSAGVFTGISGRRVNFSTDDSDCYTLFVQPGNPGTVYLYKRVSGAYTQLSSKTLTLSGFNLLKLAMIGSNPTTLQAWIQGVKQLEISDSSSPLTVAGDAALQGHVSSLPGTLQWDDFLVEDFSTQIADTRGIIEPLLTDSLQQPSQGGIYF